jgi:hypothetical protein
MYFGLGVSELKIDGASIETTRLEKVDTSLGEGLSTLIIREYRVASGLEIQRLCLCGNVPEMLGIGLRPLRVFLSAQGISYADQDLGYGRQAP